MNRRSFSTRTALLFISMAVVFGASVSQLVQPVSALVKTWTPGTMTEVSSGGNTTCAIAAGRAYCWGNGAAGRLGDGGTANSSVPVPVDTTGVLSGKTVTDISVGGAGTVCVVASGQPFCWGSNSVGQFGNNVSGTTSLIPVATTVSGALNGLTVAGIAVGDTHVCAYATNGRAYCWGAGTNGRLGRGNTTASLVPVAVTAAAGILSGKTVNSIMSGTGHTCVVASNNAYCWGLNTNGQLGTNNTTAATTPIAVNTALLGTSVARIADGGSGSSTSCALTNAGAVYCWGLNTSGQVGNNSTTQSLVPNAVQGSVVGQTVSQISTGSARTCARDTANAMHCWGAANTGGSSTTSLVAIAVTTSGVLSGVTPKWISAGSVNCAIGTDDRLYCWGLNTNGQVGDNSTTSRTTAVIVVGNSQLGNSAYRLYQNANSLTPGTALAATNTSAQLTTSGQNFRLRTDVASGAVPADALYSGGGEEHSCALANRGLLCWGLNSSGQVGNGSTTLAATPTAVTTSGVLAGKTITKVRLGGYHTCVIASGDAYCWGLNDNGQLGNNSTTNATTPVAVDKSGVLAGKTVTDISAGLRHTCVIASNAVFCWGNDNAGQIGTPAPTASYVPVAVTMSGVLAGKTLTAITTGDEFTCVIASGQVFCWGLNGNGQLGNGTSGSPTHIPVAVDTSGVLAGKTATAITAGWQHTCAVASGLAYCWGYNASRQLGNGLTTDSSVPIAVDTSGVLSGKTATDITALSGSTCAVASGLAYCWGNGSSGEIGQGAAINANTPEAVVTSGVLFGKTLTSISSGNGSHVCTVASSQLYCWGANNSRQLGTNGTTQSNVPISAGVAMNMTTMPGESSFKLQFAAKSAASCSLQSTGFGDVTGSSLIAYATNSSATHDSTIMTNANDPTPTGSTTAQKYLSAPGTFTNATTIPAGSVGLWDFSLKDNGAVADTSYCLRVTYSDGTPLDTARAYPEVRTASAQLGLDIVNASGVVVGSPVYSFGNTFMSGSCQTTTSTFGTSPQRIRVTNAVASNGWVVSLAATNGSTALWDRSDNSAKYDYNDSSGSPAGCNSGSDGDGFAGQLTVSPSAVTITPQSGCSNTGISSAANAAYVQGSIDAITLFSASSAASLGCYWEATGIGLSQKVPALQAAGAYTIDLMATVVAQ